MKNEEGIRGMVALLIAAALSDAVQNDLALFNVEDRTHIRYVYFYPRTIENEAETETIDSVSVLNFLIASTSLTVDLRRQRLVQVAPNIYRLNLLELGWSLDAWQRVVNSQTYKYASSDTPLYISGEWLIAQLSDFSESTAYYELMFGKIPADENEFFELLGIDINEARKYSVGLIEVESKVALSGIRKIEFAPKLNSYATITRDYIDIDKQTSPFETLDDPDSASDASEYVIGLPKSWDGNYGVLQAYAITDGERKIIGEAAAKVATDQTSFRGVSTVRTPGSCMSCHYMGLQTPSVNGLRSMISLGVEVYDGKKSDIERFHLSDPAKFIRRSNEDYAETVAYITGKTPEEFIKLLNTVVNLYDSPLNIDRIAIELETNSDDLRNAIAYGSDAALIKNPHIVAISHDVKLRRAIFEDLFLELHGILKQWQTANDISGSSSHQSESAPTPPPATEPDSEPAEQPSKRRVIRLRTE